MVDFDKLNRQTSEHNHRNVDRFNTSVPTSSRADFAYLNNQTYKDNNKAYPCCLFK